MKHLKKYNESFNTLQEIRGKKVGDIFKYTLDDENFKRGIYLLRIDDLRKKFNLHSNSDYAQIKVTPLFYSGDTDTLKWIPYEYDNLKPWKYYIQYQRNREIPLSNEDMNLIK